MFRLVRIYLQFTTLCITDRSNTLVNISDASKNFLNLVKPQVSTSSGTPQDNAQAQQLIQQLLTSSTDDHQALIDSILQRSAIDFAPTRGAEIGSGGYNSSVLAQLQNEARARATSDSAGAVLQAQTEAARTAANLEATKLQTNRVNTVQPPTSIGALLKTVGISVAANKIIGSGLKGLGIGADGVVKPTLGSSPNVYDYSTTPEGAAAYDSGTASGAADVGAAGNVGGQVVSGTSFGADQSLSAAELQSILGTGGDAVAGNSAAIAALTDSSITGGATTVAPTAFGDFGTPLAATSAAGLTPTAGTALGGGSGVVGGGAGYGATGSVAPGAANDLATGTIAAEGGSDVLSGASSSSALGTTAGATDVGTAGATAAGGTDLAAGAAGFAGTAFPVAATAIVGSQVAGEVAANLNGLGPSFDDFQSGFFNSIGSGLSGIGNSVGDFFSGLGL